MPEHGEGTAATEQWVELPKLPGYWRVGTKIISNDGAQLKWEKEHNPDLLLMLLKAGKADQGSQRLAAEIISAAATRALPKCKINREFRDLLIAESLIYYAQWGIRPGQAQSLIAEDCSVSEAHVRKVAGNKELMKRGKASLLDERLWSAWHKANNRSVG
jgi:hypothetical protein